MATFGNYVAPYLQQAQNDTANTIGLLASRYQQARQDQLMPSLLQKNQAEADMASAQVPYAQQMEQAKLTGTPFEQQQAAIKNAMLQTTMNVQQNQQRIANEQLNKGLRQEADQNALNTWNAAMKAYEAGIGPHPGPAPNLLANNPPGSANSPYTTSQGTGQPQGISPNGQRTNIQLPDDLKALPPGMRNSALATRIQQLPDATTKLNAAINSLDTLSQEAKALLGHPSLPAASGFTGLVSRYTPTSGALNFGDRLSSLKDQIAFATLGQLRQMSSSGGALGQVSNQEESMLQNAMAPLDPKQSANDLRRSLQQIILRSEGAKKNLSAGFQRTFGVTPDISINKAVVSRNESPQNTNNQITSSVSAPPQAVQMLKSNPTLRDAFDEKYGKGAAASVLGQ